jgi:antitoxin ParD1/3/4
VKAKVASGRCENACEILRALESEEEEHQAKLSALRAAIDEGDASGVADAGVFTRVREKLNLPTSRP